MKTCSLIVLTAGGWLRTRRLGVRTEEQSDELVSEANNPLMISSCWNLVGELINNQSSKMGETFETYDIM
jgi:hypothetical protein